jgi:hypothetical protein
VSFSTHTFELLSSCWYEELKTRSWVCFDSMLFVPWSVKTRLLCWKLFEAQTSERDKTIEPDLRSAWNSNKGKFEIFCLWDVTMPLWLCGSRHFEGPCCLHLQRFDVHEECLRGFVGDYGQVVTSVYFTGRSDLGIYSCISALKLMAFFMDLETS